MLRIAKFRPEGGKEGPEKAWRPCFSRLRASSVDILLWVRPLLLGIPFPEALHPDSVRRARKLGHIRKLPQMPAPAEPIGSRHRPQDLQCGRCDAAKGSYSRLASLRNGHHRRPATPVSTRPPRGRAAPGVAGACRPPVGPSATLTRCVYGRVTLLPDPEPCAVCKPVAIEQ